MGIREYIIAALLVLCIGNYAGWSMAANDRDRAEDKLLTVKAEHAKDIAESNTETALIAIARDQHAAEVAALSAHLTSLKTAEAVQATQDRRGTIRHAIRQAEKSADPAVLVHVPDSVRDALNQARSEAIAAGRELRAGFHHRSTGDPSRATRADPVRAAHLAGMGRLGERGAGHPDPGTHPQGWRTPVPGRAAG